MPIKAWRGVKIPAEVRKAVNEENLLNLGGVYGDKNAGAPVEYDHLKLVLTDDTVENTIFNHGFTLFKYTFCVSSSLFAFYLLNCIEKRLLDAMLSAVPR